MGEYFKELKKAKDRQKRKLKETKFSIKENFLLKKRKHHTKLKKTLDKIKQTNVLINDWVANADFLMENAEDKELLKKQLTDIYHCFVLFNYRLTNSAWTDAA